MLVRNCTWIKKKIRKFKNYTSKHFCPCHSISSHSQLFVGWSRHPELPVPSCAQTLPSQWHLCEQPALPIPLDLKGGSSTETCLSVQTLLAESLRNIQGSDPVCTRPSVVFLGASHPVAHSRVWNLFIFHSQSPKGQTKGGFLGPLNLRATCCCQKTFAT